MNARREVCSVGRPDLEDLERFMWAGDAPYEKRLTGDGGVELFAKGRGHLLRAPPSPIHRTAKVNWLIGLRFP